MHEQYLYIVATLIASAGCVFAFSSSFLLLAAYLTVALGYWFFIESVFKKFCPF